MHKKHLLTLTLILSGLALNPAMAEIVHQTASQNKSINQSVSSDIASQLHNRGLDKDVSDELAINVLSEVNEVMLVMILQNLEMLNIVTKEEVLTYLSQAALHKQKVDFESYDALIGMVSKIKQKSLDERIRKQLSHIVKINQQLFV